MEKCIVCSKEQEELFSNKTCGLSCSQSLTNKERKEENTHNFVINNPNNKKLECEKCNKSIAKPSFEKHNKTCKGIFSCLQCNTPISKKYVKYCSPKCGTEFRAKQEVDFIGFCKFCNEKKKNSNSLRNHERCCKQNPNKSVSNKGFTAPWTLERKQKHSEIMKVKNTNTSRIYTSEQRKVRSKNKIEFNKNYWTKENKEKHSESMRKAVLENPDSYTGKDIRGSRVKVYPGIDSFGKKCHFRGMWEVLISELLTKAGIKWIKDKMVGEYQFKDRSHLYYVDFYLPELNKYIEVKGLETDRDRTKYLIYSNLTIIRQDEDEVKQLKKGEKLITDFL